MLGCREVLHSLPSVLTPIFPLSRLMLLLDTTHSSSANGHGAAPSFPLVHPSALCHFPELLQVDPLLLLPPPAGAPGSSPGSATAHLPAVLTAARCSWKPFHSSEAKLKLISR